MWVSNPVIVKKASGRWKLYVDFTDINKACPKEHQSLPMIEQKVKDLHMHRLKCFLNAYKGYHQIPIAGKDKEKTTFYTREGVFYYRRLPFSLKNAGATYERLIDKVFNHQLGRNIEVNAGDIVIKSDAEEEMLADIKENLDGLRAINLYSIQRNEGAKDEEAKRKELEPEKAWKLFTDEASSSDSSEAGLILDIPEGKEYTYALRFKFETTNNEAEYEVLLAGLRIAKEMRVQENLRRFSVSGQPGQ
nr:reverse transcriptase domain-containing protein [Tanacetum cinerariifolium]